MKGKPFFEKWKIHSTCTIIHSDPSICGDRQNFWSFMSHDQSLSIAFIINKFSRLQFHIQHFVFENFRKLSKNFLKPRLDRNYNIDNNLAKFSRIIQKQPFFLKKRNISKNLVLSAPKICCLCPYNLVIFVVRPSPMGPGPYPKNTLMLMYFRAQATVFLPLNRKVFESLDFQKPSNPFLCIFIVKFSKLLNVFHHTFCTANSTF